MKKRWYYFKDIKQGKGRSRESCSEGRGLDRLQAEGGRGPDHKICEAGDAQPADRAGAQRRIRHPFREARDQEDHRPDPEGEQGLPEAAGGSLSLMRRVVEINSHLEKNKKDYQSYRGFELAESMIRRLVRYYIRKGVLPKGWKYNLEQAKLLIR